MPPQDREHKQQDLEHATESMLEECRMVLPGIQALFGFQLIAVFSAQFQEHLDTSEQHLHLAAMLCVLVAMAFIMAPAAMYRIASPRAVSASLLRISSRFLVISLVVLGAGTCIELQIVASVILGDHGRTLMVAFPVFVLFAVLWFIVPLLMRRSRAEQRSR
jgi:hypothetical protein